MTGTPGETVHKVNFATPRSFTTVLKDDIKETLFPDDPFRNFHNLPPLQKSKKYLQYFVPIFQWLPRYNLQLFRSDLLAGITVASLAIPQGISYAKLAELPPVIGLYTSFVPPIVYAFLGSSNDIAIGNVAACSLLIAENLSAVASPETEQDLYVRLVFTATFFTGIFQFILGFFRLGLLVDFLSHSTIVGFMSGTSILILMQQLKGILGLKKFTSKTDVIHVLKSIFTQTHEWKWQTAVMGIIFIVFLLATKEVKKRKPKLFWVNAIGPIIVVIVGCLFSYFIKADKHGIPTVGKLNKGINPPSLRLLNFDSKYLPTVIKTGIVTGAIALAEGIAIGRSFAVMKNTQIDGNKEMIAFGMMNVAGSLTSCYLSTGPFSKTAVNYNAGCKTPMTNIVMAICMLLTLLFLAPVFSYTPLVALSAIISVAMLGLIDYEGLYHLFKVDKFDFCIAMIAFIGVSFISMEYGIALSVGLSVIRALLYVARPAIIHLGNLADTTVYRDMHQYPIATSSVPGILVLQLGSPIYFANSTYVKERISRWVDDEGKGKGNHIEHIVIDLGGVSSIDMNGIEMLKELWEQSERKGMKVSLANPRLEVTEKLMLSHFIENFGKDSVFISVEDAVEACHFNLIESRQRHGSQV